MLQYPICQQQLVIYKYYRIIISVTLPNSKSHIQLLILILVIEDLTRYILQPEMNSSLIGIASRPQRGLEGAEPPRSLNRPDGAGIASRPQRGGLERSESLIRPDGAALSPISERDSPPPSIASRPQGGLDRRESLSRGRAPSIDALQRRCFWRMM